MFIGHYAVALAAKKAAPSLSLGTLVLAAQLVDLLWPLFLLLGLEHVRLDPGNTAMTPLDFYDYPISHSGLGALGWATALAGAYFAVRRDLHNAVIVGLMVVSHWVLDLVTHRPDLPLLPGGAERYGLGLWNSVAGSIAVEATLFVGGAWLYLRTTQARGGVGRYGLWVFLGVLAAIHAGNVAGPPPPNVELVAYAGNALWLFVAWAYWVDHDRGPIRRSAAAPASR